LVGYKKRGRKEGDRNFETNTGGEEKRVPIREGCGKKRGNRASAFALDGKKKKALVKKKRPPEEPSLAAREKKKKSALP